MKVLIEGRKDITAWWVGRVVRCYNCGRVVELENGDDSLSDWYPTQADMEVTIGCHNCGSVMTLKRIDLYESDFAWKTPATCS